MNTLLALVWLLTVVGLVGSADAAGAGSPKDVQTVVVVTVERGNPAAPRLIIGGFLTLHIHPGTGDFTGTITPSDNTSVLFLINDQGERVPDAEVTQIAVDGRIEARAVNAVFRDILGPGKHLFIIGTTSQDPGPGFTRSFVRAAGAGVGPEFGDRAVWEQQVKELNDDGDDGGGDMCPQGLQACRNDCIASFPVNSADYILCGLFCVFQCPPGT